MTVSYICDIISFILIFFIGGPDSNFKPIDKKEVSKIINKNMTELSTPTSTNKEVYEIDVNSHEEAAVNANSQMEVTANPDGLNPTTPMSELSEGIGEKRSRPVSVSAPVFYPLEDKRVEMINHLIFFFPHINYGPVTLALSDGELIEVK